MNSDPGEGRVNPRLLVITGPLRETTFVLSAVETSVGRDSSNAFAVADPSLSRRHCLIAREQDHYKICDLESRNGTLINGVSVKESALQHGDHISVGDSAFIFLLRDDAELESLERVEFQDRPTRATAQLRREDVLYLQPDLIRKELPTASRVAQNLNALLKISRVIHEIRDLEQLQEQILNSIFEIAPAERGAILLSGENAGEFASVLARHREAAGHRVVVSRTVTRQVMEQEVAILGADVIGSGDLSAVESIAASNVRSLLCVPLAVFGKVIGCIYLDSTSLSDRFSQDDLQLVAAVAGICGIALDNLRRTQWLEQENLRLSAEINLEHNMVGDSAPMKEVCQFLSRVAPKDATVLIGGETGTGKELAARAIHRNSPRCNKPFVAINCAAIPEGLLESELFGHERGAFTNAVTQKKGKFEMANGGTVFLDEIGELAQPLQVKLLRVLQEREFDRVGGTRPIVVDIRLIAATNKNLEEAVKAGAFRLDLYYRLNVLTVVMPPLRERREDIPPLANYFILKYSQKCNVKAKGISLEAMAFLSNYDWPGNVRELENAIERALVLSLTETIRPEDLPESSVETDSATGIVTARYHAAVKELKKQLIVNALEESRGNFTVAAKALGVHVNYLHRLMRNLGLRELGAKPPNKKFGTDS
jgi:transcriptional regulator with GAF, ATPase, and Fis domain